MEGVVYEGDINVDTPISDAAVYIKDSRYKTVTNTIGGFSIIIPDSLLNNNLIIIKEGFEEFSVPLNVIYAPKIEIFLQKENTLDRDISDVNGKGFVGVLNKAIDFVMNDWVALGNKETNKFDFGRLQTIPTINPIEGFRLRGGIASNSRLSPFFFVKGYAAYGFKDRKLKYRGEAIYSFLSKEYSDTEFPKNNIRLIYENDIFSPGEIHPRAVNDLLLVTYKRSENETTYRKFLELNYEKEYINGLGHSIWLRKSNIIPQGDLSFATKIDGTGNNNYQLNNFEVGASFIYNGNQSYSHSSRRRIPKNLTSPLFYLSHSIGFKDFVGGDYAYNRSEVSLQKRFEISEIANLDVVMEYSKIWNPVPFPLLVYPNQRHRFNIENNAFFLNRSLEFVADEQITARAIFVGQKLLFYKLPILNKLGIKELVSIRATYGRLSNKNKPTEDNFLFAFPVLSHEYERYVPYIEGTVGITNILGLLRLEYVHRFNYRNYPEALLGAIRLDITI